jgi:hypothetical protein
LVGSMSAVAQAVANDKADRRNTLLDSRIHNAAGGVGAASAGK